MYVDSIVYVTLIDILLSITYHMLYTLYIIKGRLSTLVMILFIYYFINYYSLKFIIKFITIVLFQAGMHKKKKKFKHYLKVLAPKFSRKG